MEHKFPQLASAVAKCPFAEIDLNNNFKSCVKFSGVIDAAKWLRVEGFLSSCQVR